ncbi:extracellular solute-binding protein [Paenibacillus macerans]|uniref:extracellular solute-binding protein n=1 Tax=Paenibacillus macerans TaxID=44252 RepID=UPI003D31B6D7
MKTRTKKWAVLLAASVLAASIAGCSGGSSGANGNSAGPGDGKGNAPADDKLQPVTISTVMEVAPETKFKNGETIENNVVTMWAKDKFNIDFKFDWTVSGLNSTYQNKLQLMLASNEKFPDVFRVSDKQLIADLIASGKVMDVTEAVEKYASPRLKELYQKFPQAVWPVSADGKMYAVPVLSGGNISDLNMWIRQDWLDKLGLQAPTTIAELENVMDAFVNRDPDSNNKRDTIGITLAMKNAIVNWMGDGSFLVGSFGAKAGDRQWGPDGNGGLQYGGVQPEMKMTLGKLYEWFNKGYLDPEFAILDENKAIESFTSGRSGIVFGAPWMTDWPFTDMLKLHPEAKLKPYPVPAGADGSIGRRGESIFYSAIMFNKDFKHIDRFFDYLNTVYGWSYGEGDFKYGFAEGYDYALDASGKPVYDDASIPNGKVEPIKYLPGTYHQLDIPFLQYDVYKKLHDGGKPENTVEERWATADPLSLEAGAIVAEQNPYRMEDLYQGPATPTMQSKQEYLEKIEKEAYAQIIYGKKPLDSFDQFVEDWKKNGGDEITKEVNEWYQTVAQIK